MTETQVMEITRQAVVLILKISAPMLLVSLIIGLVISILQTVTSIQEQTLTFVPKLVGILVTILVAGRWIINSVVEFFTYLMQNMAYFIKG
ncbi:MAG: flagellar biosynthesis protein FliQ [Lachnospiraceae bacterium]|nr:flagellar biosynthesis protein FliQ [Lachnospiraceae bacterium]